MFIWKKPDNSDDEGCFCCICGCIVIPEDNETIVDSNGNFYCDLHTRFCNETENEHD